MLCQIIVHKVLSPWIATLNLLDCVGNHRQTVTRCFERSVSLQQGFLEVVESTLFLQMLPRAEAAKGCYDNDSDVWPVSEGYIGQAVAFFQDIVVYAILPFLPLEIPVGFFRTTVAVVYIFGMEFPAVPLQKVFAADIDSEPLDVVTRSEAAWKTVVEKILHAYSRVAEVEVILFEIHFCVLECLFLTTLYWIESFATSDFRDFFSGAMFSFVIILWSRVVAVMIRRKSQSAHELVEVIMAPIGYQDRLGRYDCGSCCGDFL